MCHIAWSQSRLEFADLVIQPGASGDDLALKVVTARLVIGLLMFELLLKFGGHRFGGVHRNQRFLRGERKLLKRTDRFTDQSVTNATKNESQSHVRKKVGCPRRKTCCDQQACQDSPEAEH